MSLFVIAKYPTSIRLYSAGRCDSMTLLGGSDTKAARSASSMTVEQNYWSPVQKLRATERPGMKGCTAGQGSEVEKRSPDLGARQVTYRLEVFQKVAGRLWVR